MGTLYAIRILYAVTVAWLPNEFGDMATWRTYEQCESHARILRNDFSQDVLCLPIPRGEK